MELCQKCNNKTVLADRLITVFYPDQEPYENGVIENCESEEIDAEVRVGIRYCEKCGKVTDAWIESPRFGDESNQAIEPTGEAGGS